MAEKDSIGMTNPDAEVDRDPQGRPVICAALPRLRWQSMMRNREPGFMHVSAVAKGVRWVPLRSKELLRPADAARSTLP